MIADFDGDSSILYGDLESGNYPMLCTRNVVMFPTVISPVLVGREQSTNLMRMLQKKEDPVLCVFCQKDENVDNPTLDDMYREGVFAKLLRVMELPGGDGNVNAIIQALGPARLVKINRRMPYYTAAVEAVEEEIPEEGDTQFDTLLAELREKTIEYIKADDGIPNEAEFALKNITNKVMLPNFICANMPFSAQEKMDLLSTHSLVDRVYQILKLEDRNISLLRLQQEIRQKTRNDLDAQQREYFLQQQLKNIKEELGDDYGSPERKELYEKAIAWKEAVDSGYVPPISAPGDAALAYPRASQGSKVVVDDDTMKLYREFLELERAKKEMTEKEKDLKLKLAERMKDNERLVTSEGVSLLTWKNETRESFDSKKFRLEFPELAEDYITVTTRRVMRLPQKMLRA